MGLWPNLQAIKEWTHEAWIPLLKNNVLVFILGNGFFFSLFAIMGDRDSIFLFGHFFMGSKGLFVTPLIMDFNPTMEISKGPVWVRLSHFSFALWDNNILKLIRDKLNRYIEHIEIKASIISCARICVAIDLKKCLWEAIQLNVVG